MEVRRFIGAYPAFSLRKILLLSTLVFRGDYRGFQGSWTGFSPMMWKERKGCARRTLIGAGRYVRLIQSFKCELSESVF